MNVPTFIGLYFLTNIAAAFISITDKRLSGRLQGSVYRTTDSIGELQCGHQCLVTQKCMSINYKRQSLTCEQSTTGDKTNLTEVHTWSYLEKSDIIDIYRRDPCANWTCPSNSMCVVLSSGELTCMITACDKAPTVPNATISVYKAGVAEQTTYTCNTYYQMEGSGNIICKANGTFTEPDFYCELIPCPIAPSIAHSVKGSNYERSVGSTVTYSCKTGYNMADGPGILTCELGGHWSTVTFSCKEIPCADAPSVTKAAVNSYQQSVGSKAHYSCLIGYKISDGPAEIECLLGGQWSTVHFSCNEIPCTDAPSVTKATVNSYQKSVGSKAHYSCVAGYKVSDGPAEIECLLGGQWSTVHFSCTEIRCPAAPSVSNAALSAYQKSVGSQASYSCNTGYSIKGGPAMVTCELGGQWSTVTFSCNKIPCPGAPLVTNAVVGTYKKTVGSEATYTCAPGYIVSNGPAMVTCILGGHWSTVKFSCVVLAMECPTPPEIDNALLGTYCQTMGCSAAYSCKYGYIYIEMFPSVIKCQSDGSWSTVNFFCELDFMFV